LKLRDGSSLVVKYLKKGSELSVVPWLVSSSEGRQPQFISTGFIQLTPKKFGKFVFHAVSYAIIKPEFQGLGIVPATYEAIVGSAGLNLLANDSQSGGARAVWSKLSTATSLVIWAIFADTFIVDPKKPKEDYVYGIQLSNKFKSSKKDIKELTRAIVQLPDGTISTKEVYNDEGPADQLTSLIMTKRDGSLDRVIKKFDALGSMNLPHKPTDDKEIQTLYTAFNSILLQK